MLDELNDAMNKAAEAQEYERAARLRDQIDALRITTRKTTRYHRLPNQLPLTIDPDRDITELAEKLNLLEPLPRIEGFDISNISGTFMVGSMVVFRNGRPANSEYRRYKMKAVQSQNDFACMGEVVARRFTRLKKEERPMPNLILIDGGKGQLSAAKSALDVLGLGYIPIIGLAKRLEDVFLPGMSEPQNISKTSFVLPYIFQLKGHKPPLQDIFQLF